MIVPDINLLLYAYDSSCSVHQEAKRWWEACMSGTELVGLSYPVVFGFVRIATSGRIYRRPLTLDEAMTSVRGWMERRVSVTLEPSADHVQEVHRLLAAAGAAGGNLVTDARIAALALANKAVIYTADHDFTRFPGVRTYYPVG